MRLNKGWHEIWDTIVAKVGMENTALTLSVEVAGTCLPAGRKVEKTGDFYHFILYFLKNKSKTTDLSVCACLPYRHRQAGYIE